MREVLVPSADAVKRRADFARWWTWLRIASRFSKRPARERRHAGHDRAGAAVVAICTADCIAGAGSGFDVVSVATGLHSTRFRVLSGPRPFDFRASASTESPLLTGRLSRLEAEFPDHTGRSRASQ